MYSAGQARISRAYRVRLKPTREQAHTLNRLFGAGRHVWNQALEIRSAAYRERGEKLNWVGLSKWLTGYRKAPGTEWLSTLPREPLNQVLRDQERAFKNFFSKRAKYPRFRRYGAHGTIRFTLDPRRTQVDRVAGTVQLDGVGRVRFKNTYGGMEGRLRSVSVSRDAAGRYFASFTADAVPAKPVTLPARASVGVDLGLGRLATLSTGETVAAPKALTKKLKRLARYQRHAARQRDAALVKMGLDPKKPLPKGTRIPTSNRAGRTRRRIGRLHAKVADTRREALHQLTHRLTRDHGVLALEDLNLKAMARGRGRRSFRRSVSDAALGEFRRQVEYKASWRGRTVVAVDRFYASSKTCSGCGHVHHGLKLSERTWVCPACHAAHDRDHNAALNIEREGLRLLSTPGSGGMEGLALDARGETPVRGAAEASVSAALTRPDSLNREPVKRRPPAARSRRNRRERRTARA